MIKSAIFTKPKNNLITFSLILLLLFFSFFEESMLKGIPLIAFGSIFCIPIVIAVEFILNRITIDISDIKIIAAFAIFIIFQLCGISFNSFYKSLTPIYRSFSALAAVIYIRHLKLDEYKCRALYILSAMVIVAGFVSFLLPEQENGNAYFGNLNTVGVLFFTFFIINYFLHLKTKSFLSMVFMFGLAAMVVFSNTRTAMFLLVITVALCVIISFTKIKKINPELFFLITVSAMVLFIIFYFNIKRNGLYDILNEISQKIFRKNFDSGRPDLWNFAVEAVGERWFIGRGNYAELSDFVYWTKTPHSVFFDVYLKNGLSGLFFFIVLLTTVLHEKGKYNNSRLNILIMISAFIIIFYNAVGIVLTKPRSGIGLIHWVIIALPYFDFFKSNLKDSLI
ncbi:MAG: O-antigen ligase family protein [Candidatus Borkfalkiaceae bacterium]|nr:O-antigen ligase family protein [Christensenellaceae bacterium]